MFDDTLGSIGVNSTPIPPYYPKLKDSTVATVGRFGWSTERRETCDEIRKLIHATLDRPCNMHPLINRDEVKWQVDAIIERICQDEKPLNRLREEYSQLDRDVQELQKQINSGQRNKCLEYTQTKLVFNAVGEVGRRFFIHARSAPDYNPDSMFREDVPEFRPNQRAI